MLVKFLFLFLILIIGILANPLKSNSNDLQSKFLVSKLPGLYSNIPQDDIPLMFAGQLELFPENNTNYFFWKYVDSNKLNESKNKTIFWLNGGPGCSSMDGALMESGPFRINENGEVTYNNGSWHKSGDIVFVDQPAGTGFSFTDEYVHDLDQVVLDFLRFMDKFFEIFPEDLNNEIYFAGESYAGQYIPYIANGILQYNKNLRQDQHHYNLKGLLIGNGWISPNEQSLSYLPFVYQAGIIKSSNPAYHQILSQHEKCQKIVDQIDTNNDGLVHDFEVSSGTCEEILNIILRASRDYSNKDQACYNMYDYTLKDTYPSCGMNWPPDLTVVTPFLNNDEVKSDLNLKNHKSWKECNGRVGNHFSAQNSLPAVHLLPDILKEIKVVLFNGNRDIICNYIGTENMIKKLTWNGDKGFNNNDEVIDWIHDEKVSGYIKSSRNLTFVNVFDASHMVPFDIPERSRALMDLIYGNFDEVEQENKNLRKAYKTSPLGERQLRIQDELQKLVSSASSSIISLASSSPISSISSPTSSSTSKIEAVPVPSTSADHSDSDSDSGSDSDEEDNKKNHTSRITRLIQLLVIIVLIWGICILYSSYTSKPASIIKTRSTSAGRKKNVQWADQLRQFQENDDFPLKDNKNQGLLSKAFNKLKIGHSNDGQGTYTPTGTSEDIELGENFSANDHELDDFIIETDDESDDQEQEERVQDSAPESEEIDTRLTNQS